MQFLSTNQQCQIKARKAKRPYIPSTADAFKCLEHSHTDCCFLVRLTGNYIKLDFLIRSEQLLITRTGWCELIIPVLWELHLLLVRHRIEFKLATLVYKTLHCRYLSDECQLVSDADCRRPLLTGCIVMCRTMDQDSAG